MRFRYPVFVTERFRYTLEKKGFAGYEEIDIYRKLYAFSKNPDQPGFNFEKLKNFSNRFTIRLDRGNRLFGSKILTHDQREILIFYKVASHDYYQKLRNESGIIAAEELTSIDELPAVEEPAPERRIYNLEPWFKRYREATKLKMLDEYEWDTLMNLTAQQEALVDLSQISWNPVKKLTPLLVQGGAGTGKSTTALHRLLAVQNKCKELPHWKPDIFLVSYDSFLVRVLAAFFGALNHIQSDREQFTGEPELPERETVAQVEIMTTMEFWRELAKRWGLISEGAPANKSDSNDGKDQADKKKDYDRGNLYQNLKLIINKRYGSHINTDLKYLTRIFFSLKLLVKRGAHRKSRMLEWDETEERFRQWVENGKIVLKDDPNTIFNLFRHYQEFAASKHQLTKDEADLVRDLYEFVLDNDPADLREMVLIVDEVQDLAELELALFFEILKRGFSNWKEYESLPFSPMMLLGDANQQIRSTGFDWVKFLGNLFLDTNLGWNTESVFELNQNVRNTRQIARADRFLFDILDKQYQCEYPLEPVEDGPTPFLLVFNDDEEMEAELEKFLNGRLPPCVTLLYESEKLRNRLRYLEDRKSFLAFDLADSKGMEFEDLVLVGFFSGFEDGTTELKQIPPDLRNLWHVGLSRARTNLLVCITRREMRFIKEILFPENFHQFLQCFKIAESPKERMVALREFKRQCQPKLQGINRIFRDVLTTKALWDKFIKEKSRQNRLEVFANARASRREAKTILEWYEDYLEENPADPEMLYELAWMYDSVGESSKFHNLTQTGKNASCFNKNELVFYYDEVVNFDQEMTPAISQLIKSVVENWDITEIRHALESVNNRALQNWLLKKLVDYYNRKAKEILKALEE
ncbi:MAG: hypothetical protein Kow0037_30890 [Calditrichia bacterium]